MLGPILFNLYINDLFFFIEVASVHNFADDNTYLSGENTFQINWYVRIRK